MKAEETTAPQDSSAMARLRDALRKLYHGNSPLAFKFQLAAAAVDLAIIAFFIATPLLQETRSFLWVDYLVAAIVAADMLARLLASTDMLRLMRQPTWLVDFF
ncbi:MAG TPA: ion transporter, partial [Mesorhizobium sp.]